MTLFVLLCYNKFVGRFKTTQFCFSTKGGIKMKKTFKALIAFVLAVAMLFSFSVTGLAKQTAQAKADDKIVARVSILSCMYIWPISGHTWFYVENLSDKPIQVGLYEVPVGQGVSIGSYAFTARDGFGLYYNLEAYRENKKDNEGTHWSITQDMTKDQLKKFSDDIAGYINGWSFYFNCCFFTFSIWNKNSDNFFIPLVIPAITQMEVRMAGAKQGVVDMYEPRKDQVFRQKGSGKNAKLVPVSQATFDASKAN